MTIPFLKRSTPLLAALALAGCANYAGIHPHATMTKPDQLSMTDAKTDWPQQRPWEMLHDPVLTSLIDQALANNPNLQVAATRLDKVAALVSEADANRYPEVGVGASSIRERFTENGLYPPPFGGSTYSTNLLMVNAKYEFDFWGRNRDALAAAVSEQRAAQAELESARLLIETSVTKSYYTLASNLEQKAMLEKFLAEREELTNIAEHAKTAGLETAQAVKGTNQGIPAMKATISYLDEQIELSRNALAALIGKGPEATRDVVAKFPDNVSVGVPASIPADLIGRRADISAARWRVEAAAKMINVSKAGFYPDINLSAFAGFSSLYFSNWLKGSSKDYGGGPAISLPIFDAGRLRADLRDKTADYDLAVASYNQTLVEAVHDVANLLTSLKALGEQQKQQNALLQSASEVYEIAVQREKAGLADRVAVLNAEASLLNQQSLAIVLRARSVDLHVNLMRALGGGFDERTEFPQAANDNPN